MCVNLAGIDFQRGLLMSDNDSKTILPDYLPFIDWMKFLGMLVIVYGHSPGGWLWRPTDPFNIKQLGVVCFVFATGVSLSREHRTQARILFNRLFDMYAIGIGYALILSAITYFSLQELSLSNYSPYVFGVNVFFNFFPANPTTWYIGMYLHLIVLWLILLRHVRVQFWMIVASAVMEVPIRAVLMHNAGDFVAYMLITNWLTVFLAGLWIGQNGAKVRNEIGSALLLAMGMLGLLLVWPQFISVFFGEVEQYSFPFMRISMDGTLSTLFTTSIAVTFLYLIYLIFIYQTTLRLPASKVVKFFARNTVFVFVVHIPLVFYFSEVFYENVESVLLRAIISILVYYVCSRLFQRFSFTD